MYFTIVSADNNKSVDLDTSDLIHMIWAAGDLSKRPFVVEYDRVKLESIVQKLSSILER
jgi:arsenate reductase-like glutaredoxin family protein